MPFLRGMYIPSLWIRKVIIMTDKIFGEVEYEEDYGYTASRNVVFLGIEQTADIFIEYDDDAESITDFQRSAYKALMDNWDAIQHKIANAILSYYNHDEKYSYGPDDEEESALWWPDIETEDELAGKIHLDSIVISTEYIMESKGKDPVYVLFDRDWGGDDGDDNGVAVLIENGEVTEVGYKNIAY